MPALGDLIGPYRLISPLGKGAMGEVWRARDERLDRYVALKILPADLADDPERRVRMLREAKAAAAIRHHNVVTLFDVVRHEGDDILVMELVEGRTLSDALRKDGAPSLAIALRWLEDIADALAAAHARGILHRDIKAANVMVASDGGIKVLDFGLAKLRDGSEPASTSSLAPRPRPQVSGEIRVALDATMPSTSGPIKLIPSEPSADPASTSGLDQTLAPAALERAPQLTSSERRIRPPTDPAPVRDTFSVSSYQTHAGQLLGTPLYMAPEQVDGALPDERSEVFSVGVLGYELLAGKPPYVAGSMEELFAQISHGTPPPLKVPASVAALVERALAKDPAARFPTMAALRDAVAATRAELFAPPARRWPLVVAAAVLLAAAGAGAWYWRGHRVAAEQPGDTYVARALEEYDVFFGPKALSSLRAALRIAPAHPRANAYMILFGGASEEDRAAALTAARAAQPRTAARSRDRALLDAAIALATAGPRAARAALEASGAAAERELAFWAAELDYRAGNYAVAEAAYQALLAEPAPLFRGRIYDHDSSVLLYLDRPQDALRIGTLYRDAFPGEADAVAVYATTLAAAGRGDEAVAAAEEALRLNEGEDTFAGLAKVLALQGELIRAKDLYKKSIERAGDERRPIRRAALGLLQWMTGDAPAARATLAPCRRGGDEATIRQRGACLFVAGLVDRGDAAALATELDALAAEATALQPAYGNPAGLADLLRAYVAFTGNGCLFQRQPAPAPPDPAVVPTLQAAYAAPTDFYVAYHVPFLATWSACEAAALAAARGDRPAARAILAPIASRAPGRRWLVETLATWVK